MYMLATSFENEKYNLVDNIWNPEEFYNNEYVKRMNKHSLKFNIVAIYFMQF